MEVCSKEGIEDSKKCSNCRKGNNWRVMESWGIIAVLTEAADLSVRSRPSSTQCAIIGSSSCEESTLRPLACSLSTFYHRHDQSLDIAYQAIRERSRMPFPSTSSVTLHTRKPRFLGAPRLLRGFSASGAESLINFIHDVLGVTPGPAVLGVTLCDHSVCPVGIFRSNCGIRHAEGGVAGNSGRHVFISLFRRGRSIDHRSILSTDVVLSTAGECSRGL